MDTPDKIYLNTPKIQPELDNTTWDTKTYADCENLEYIRKDALLEWAKDWQNELDDSLGASMVHHVLNEVIKKIKSL